MIVMENGYNRPSHSHSSLKHKRSGYEPSDTETEWQESPWHDGLLTSNRPKTPSDPARTISPLNRSQRYTSKVEHDSYSPVKASITSPIPRRHSRSPYKPSRDGDNGISAIAHADLRRNVSPFEVPEHRRHVSPYKTKREESLSNHENNDLSMKPSGDGDNGISALAQADLRSNGSPFEVSEHRRHVSPYKIKREELMLNHENNDLTSSFRKRNQRTPPKYLNFVERGSHLQHQEVSRVKERPSYSRTTRSMSVPKPREREKDQKVSSNPAMNGAGRSPSPLAKTTSHKVRESAYTRDSSAQERNEMVTNVKLSKSPSATYLPMQSTDSISPGDIFFSRDCTDLQKNFATKNSNYGSNFAPMFKVISESNTAVQLGTTGITSSDQIPQVVSVSTVLSRTNTNSAVSRLSSGSSSNFSGKLSDGSGKLSGSFRKFTANRQRSQTDAWFSCVKGGSCRKSKSPESRAINEASFIEKAFVVEELRPFWADKHRPLSLNGFICHKQQAQHLKHLISHNCPHILLKGPTGSGKKSLCMALMHDIFGDSSLNISHDLRHFHVQEARPMQITVPLTSSPHHVELNLKSESKNARYALIGLVKEIAGNRSLTPEVSDASFKADYKVIVLYDVDKVAENVQHLIRWIMDCYTDACKIILCCEDDSDLLDSVKSRCKLINVDAPVTHEIMEALIQIAKKENFELPMSFAARIATKSKQNLRKAIMALEACKAHNYPFIDEQPIPLGWEDILVELAAEIISDPSPKRLFRARGKFQKLLVDFVHPRLILQKLVEQFLMGVEAGLKRELYYWHAYYDKRLPTGTSALLKLEEFVAKFMSIHRKSCTGPLFI